MNKTMQALTKAMSVLTETTNGHGGAVVRRNGKIMSQSGINLTDNEAVLIADKMFSNDFEYFQMNGVTIGNHKYAVTNSDKEEGVVTAMKGNSGINIVKGKNTIVIGYYNNTSKPVTAGQNHIATYSLKTIINNGELPKEIPFSVPSVFRKEFSALKRKGEISWDDLVKLLVGPTKGHGGAILRSDGQLLGQDGIKMTEEEAKALAEVFKENNYTLLRENGIKVNGKKFPVTNSDDDEGVFTAMKKNEGINVVKGNNIIVVGYFTMKTSRVLPADNHLATYKLAKELEKYTIEEEKKLTVVSNNVVEKFEKEEVKEVKQFDYKGGFEAIKSEGKGHGVAVLTHSGAIVDQEGLNLNQEEATLISQKVIGGEVDYFQMNGVTIGNHKYAVTNSDKEEGVVTAMKGNSGVNIVKGKNTIVIGYYNNTSKPVTAGQNHIATYALKTLINDGNLPQDNKVVMPSIFHKELQKIENGKLSWADMSKLLTLPSCGNGGIILKSDGAILSQEGIHISVEEAKTIADTFNEQKVSSMCSDGVMVDGKKFSVTNSDSIDGMVTAVRDNEGINIIRGQNVVVIGYYKKADPILPAKNLKAAFSALSLVDDIEDDDAQVA
ncbi:hypothetical protein EIN_269560 [Entamoeba invadens IP1]|uniref:Profilin n=1 Tax=Entamoeba invadens IP1 TaxID=370355 RepID=A0A0A1UE89_ENTIV|nr:hypothetical protein EIN_269560 [Entamoeba invadens IP1]ELP91120.1 hypothetical protein EIN_269560 [Entamoeba invadens IP1]|eukprot:XP_004257891.1 hypothetical protein EIN_269560 [Entamoeba invadens IP1]